MLLMIMANLFNRAQTYEGGIGPYPGKEAHNGYTFCGIAAMEILGDMKKLNLNKLIVNIYNRIFFCFFY